jgi:hypothetical protein
VTAVVLALLIAGSLTVLILTRSRLQPQIKPTFSYSNGIATASVDQVPEVETNEKMCLRRPNFSSGAWMCPDDRLVSYIPFRDKIGSKAGCGAVPSDVVAVNLTFTRRGRNFFTPKTISVKNVPTGGGEKARLWCSIDPSGYTLVDIEFERTSKPPPTTGFSR